jgi:hypothetical protein
MAITSNQMSPFKIISLSDKPNQFFAKIAHTITDKQPEIPANKE